MGELREIQKTLMAEDWTPLREVPKILSDTPNIYQLRTNEMRDILTPVENRINVRQRQKEQLDSATMTTLELQRTSTGNAEEEDAEDRDAGSKLMMNTANSNRRLVPLTKGEDMTAAPELSDPGGPGAQTGL